MGEPPSAVNTASAAGVLVDKVGQVLWMDRTAAADGRSLVECSKRTLMALDAVVEETGILTWREAGNERRQRRFHVPHHTDLYRVAATEVRRVDVDLHDAGVIGIELAPGEVATEQQ
jgi:hypothetical protein